MNAIQPSFYQWRKKVNAALAMDASRVTILFTSPSGRSYSIEPEELQNPQSGTYTAKLSDGQGGAQEFTSDFDVTPERVQRRTPEDTFIARYERMADDLEHARQVAEARARAAEVEKQTALETVAAQMRRIGELEQRIAELEQRHESLIDEDTAELLMACVEQWSGATELRNNVDLLLGALEQDPRTAARLAQRMPELIATLTQDIQKDMEN